MCRLGRPLKDRPVGSFTQPFLSQPSSPHTRSDLSQHHHPGLSPGVQLAYAEWIDTLTSPQEVCVCVCMNVWERAVEAEREGKSVLNANICSQCEKQIKVTTFHFCRQSVHMFFWNSKLESQSLIVTRIQGGSATNPSGQVWPLCLLKKQTRPQSLLLLLLPPWFI